MTDISVVIPYLNDGSSDLRFALRSIEKHLTGYGDIWIIGDAPPWATGLHCLPVSDSRDIKNKEKNIFRKIMRACEEPQISDLFCFWNDDHYLLQPYHAAEFPYYTHRSLRQGQLENEGAYRTTLIRTEKLLKSMLMGTQDFDCHCPIVYEKAKFRECWDGVEWRDYGYALKSVYCAYHNVKETPCTDLKLTGRRFKEFETRIKGRGWFSTGNSNPEIERFLSSLFPKKSSFEK